MPELRDTIDTLLFGMFLFGLLLTVGTALLGGVHLGGHVGHGGHAGHGEAQGWLPFSLTAGLVFLTWFGGVGFLLRRGADLPTLPALGLALLVGFGLASLVQRLLTLLGRSASSELDPGQVRVAGSFGVLSSPVRAGGIGEVVYELRGARQALPARCADGSPLPTGAEVVILRVERGIALVQPFDTLADHQLGAPSVPPP